MTTTTRSADTALHFLRTAYEPDDCVALLLKSHHTGDTAQRVGPLAMLLDLRVHAWLRAMNVQRYSVFVGVNTIQPGVRVRTKRAIAAIRHVFLDADHDATQLLATLTARR